MKPADQIRAHVQHKYIEPARRRGERTVQIRAGAVLKEMGLGNDRAPSVCGALKAKKFREDNWLDLEKLEGPPKKMATTVLFTFRLLPEASRGKESADDTAFLRMRGIAKEVFARLGGGEAFIKRERAHFYGPE